MAILEKANLQPLIPDFSSTTKETRWVPSGGSVIFGVPQIFFYDGKPWLPANRYAIEKLQAAFGNNYRSVYSIMSHLKAYASWLETLEIDWLYFPLKKKDRCLFRFRGYLIQQRDAGRLSSSTTKARMAAVVAFYRWAQASGWVKRNNLWTDKTKVLAFNTIEGFSRTMDVQTSELSIPNNRRLGTVLEDGLIPVSDDNRTTLLNYLAKNKLQELYLIMAIGFFTGARSETIRTLRISSIENALEDPTIPDVLRIPVGPGTDVRTKYEVNGSLLFPKSLVDQLLLYAYSPRRLSRQARASDTERTLLFLTVRGNSYKENSFTKLISDLRKKLAAEGLNQYQNFKFHQTRATFGTSLMRIAMNKLPNQSDAIAFVKSVMLHKDESTTWKYIKFIDTEPVKEALSDEFFHLFTGTGTNESEKNRLIEEFTYRAPS